LLFELIMFTCYILFALASVASAAHFGIDSSSVSIPIDTKARYRHEITSPVHHHTKTTLLIQIIPRGGDGLIEENPEYESDDDNEYDDSDSEEESEVYDDEEEEEESTKTFLSKKLKMYNHSKANKSTPSSSTLDFDIFGIKLGVGYKDLTILITILVCHDGIPIVCKLSKMEIIAAFVIIEVGLLIFHHYQDNKYKKKKIKKMGDNTNSTQTTEEEEQQHQLRIPIVPILSLLLILGLQYIIPKSTQFFILPLILRALSGDLDPDSTLGKLLLPIFGNLINMNNNDDEDIITKMSYVPPLEQHYSFEQVNEKYVRDYGAYKKAWGVNPLVARASTSSTGGSVGRGMSSRGPTSGIGALSSLFMNTKPSSPTIIPKSSSSTSPKLNYPTQYNNGTVILLDMTKLDTQATKMENIRDQISFLIQLVDSLKEGEEKEKVKVLASTIVDALHVVGDEEEQLKLQRSMDMLNVTAMNVTTSLASSSETNDTSSVTSIEVRDDQPTTPTVEVVVLLESPGGGVSQYGLAASHLQRLRSNPNVKLTICVDTVAASGGYMMACMSSPNQLYCAPFAMIGSIGVIGQSINVQKTLESYGVKPYVFRGGKSKNPVGLVGDVTKEGVQHMQGMIDRIHDAFRDHVAGAREGAFAEALLSDDCGIPKPREGYFHPNLGSSRVDQMTTNGVSMAHVMDQVASGDVYLGVQAIKMGLVDRLITSDEYISERIRHGARVLKLINYHRASGLSDLFSAPNPRHRMMNRSNGMVNVLKKIVYKMTSAVLAWVEEDGKAYYCW